MTAQIINLAHKAEQARIQLARQDPAAFNEYVLRDLETGRPIKNAPYHYEWHAHYSRYPRTVLLAHLESGKTSGISIGRTLWEIGHNHELRTVIVQATEGKAKKLNRAIKGHIESSKELHRVFPRLLPGRPWTDEAITVRRETVDPNPTVQAVGVGCDVIGARIDNLILDDVLRFENVRTDGERKKLIAWFNSTLSGRLTARSRIFAVGTPWHSEDILAVLAKRPGWFFARYPVLDERGRPRWPQRWPLDRIARFKVDPGPLEYMRQLMCTPANDDLQRCQPEWFDRCFARGAGLPMLQELRGLPPGAFTVTGVDLAGKKKRSALTVFFTILVLPPSWDRRILHIESGRFTAPEIRDRCIAIQRAFGSSLWVENVGLQTWMLEILEEKAPDIPVFGHQTGMNKWDPVTGVETVFLELHQGRWIIPSRLVDGRYRVHPEVEEWKGECVNFHPSQHTGDRCMAGWIAKCGARIIAATFDQHQDDAITVGGHGVTVHEPDLSDPEEQHWAKWNAQGAA